MWAVDYWLTRPDGGTLSNQPVQECADSVNNNLWCATISPAATTPYGQYTIKFRVVDAVGHVSNSAEHTFYIDGTKPDLTINSFSSGWTTPDSSDEDSQTWTVHFAGSAADPQLWGFKPGVGLDTSSVKVSLYDAIGAVAAGGPYIATVSGTAWSVDYNITGLQPSGWYTATVEATDLLGNSNSVSTRLRFDLRAPSIEFNSGSLPAEMIGAATFAGIANDFPIPAGGMAFHFTEAASATSFKGGIDGAIAASCTSCPSQTSSSFG